ncbi:MAG: phosphotransferase family protein, partial [Pseudomonadales bacterium]|nr:phosphotransferase family protein [Pseudomonadales bacterium]
MKASDEAGEVRQGEELPREAIDSYLKTLQPTLLGIPNIRQFAGGASNLTYLVSYPEYDFILRRPPLGRKAKGAHDMKRESELMCALRPVYPYVPAVLGYTAIEGVGECYVMERMLGYIPRKDMPKGIELNPQETRQLCLNVIDRLIDLHQVDVAKAGLLHLGKGEGYIARQIHGWSERFMQAHTEDVGNFSSVMQWLKDKMPSKDNALCLIHNDYRFDNVVLDANNPFNVVGVLDWEMATLGDPLMDLGNSLAYWVQADDEPMMQMMRRQPTHLP